MKIQLIRNATMKITYAGKTFLTDPMLSPKGAIRSFAGIAPNPTVDLPLPAAAILDGVDAVVVSHSHPDHLDDAAVAALPKTLPVFCQPCDRQKLAEAGFQTVISVETSYSWEGVTVTRTGGNHGSGKILELMGAVSGFVFQAAGEPTVYWVGDSIWCEDVADSLKRFSPDIIIPHAGGATIPGFDPIIMTDEQVLAMMAAAPAAVTAAVHMESLDHCAVTRAALREAADRAGIHPSRLLIPSDGETIAF